VISISELICLFQNDEKLSEKMEDEDGEGLEAGLENMSLEHGRLDDDSRSSEGDPSRFYNLQVGHSVKIKFSF